MFKLAIALGVAFALMPENVRFSAENENTTETKIEVSTYDTLNAAHSLYEDIAGFCERNQETCLTGQALAQKITGQARAAINQFAASSSANNNHQIKDDVVTGSINVPAS